jgi:uncharacterized membrane protein (UPF0127 family)
VESREPWRLRGLERRLILGSEVPIATKLRARLLGLAFLSRNDAGPGLLLPRSRSVHTFGMRFPLDIVFLDGEGKVVELRRAVPPGRVLRCGGARQVLELPSPIWR